MRQINWRLVRWVDSLAGIPLVWLTRIIASPARRPAPDQYRKILLIKFWGIGNIFMMLPSVKSLKNSYPGAQIEFLTLMTNRDAARLVTVFSKVHFVDTSTYVSLVRTLVGAIISLRQRGFDLVIDFEQFARVSALVAALAGRVKTIGFKTEGQRRDALFTDPVEYTNSTHITRAFFSLAQAAGCEEYPESIEGMLEVSTSETISSLIGSRGGGTVVMHVGTSKNFQWRRWPSEYFAELADMLVGSLGVRIVFTGVADERALIEAVRSGMKQAEYTVNMGGSLSFADYVSLIKSSRFVVACDTAPVHICSALGIGVAGLYGPNDPALYGPWGKGLFLSFYEPPGCSPCITNYNAKINVCRLEGACMRNITPELVFEGIMRKFT